MSPRSTPPRLAPASMSITELCRLYRILDNLEETANMAHQYVCHVDGDGAVSAYVDCLQEYIAEERFRLVEALSSTLRTFERSGHQPV